MFGEVDEFSYYNFMSIILNRIYEVKNMNSIRESGIVNTFYKNFNSYVILLLIKSNNQRGWIKTLFLITNFMIVRCLTPTCELN